MNQRVVSIIATVIVAAIGLLALSALRQDAWYPGVLVFWVAACVLGELFWVRTLSGDSVHSLAATVKLSSIFILGPWSSLPVIWVATLIGNSVFRRAAWYKALYNASQLAVAGASAALVYHLLGGPMLRGSRELSPIAGLGGVTAVLTGREFLVAFLAAGVLYILVNNTLMAWLMSAVTGRRMGSLWKENCLYPEEIQSSAALVLLTPLLILLYGRLGIVGMAILFACLGLVRIANVRYVRLVNTQDSLVRGERMAAMGDMAEEIGKMLGTFLEELKERTSHLRGRTRQDADEATNRSVDIIGVNVDRMAALVDGLAAFSHQETRKTPVDVNELIRRAIEFVRPQNRFDGVAFDFAEEPLLPTVQADAGQLQQVLLNLFTNAADALRESGHEDGLIRVRTSRGERDGRVVILVADNGPGIPRDSLARIFEPHFTTKATGHGFGLSTVFRIAANHDGEVRAANLPDGGASFHFELPAA